MADLNVEIGQDVLLFWQGAATDTPLYPQATIYDVDGNELDVVDLPYISDGLYRSKWNTTGFARGNYYVRYFIYIDSGHTSQSPVDRPGVDTIKVGATAGGFLGGSSDGGSSKIGRFALSKEELEAIAKALFKLMKPSLEAMKPDWTNMDATCKMLAGAIDALEVIPKELKTEIKALTKAGTDTIEDLGTKISVQAAKSVSRETASLEKIATILGNLKTQIKSLEATTEAHRDSVDEIPSETARIATRSFSLISDELESTVNSVASKLPGIIAKKLSDTDIDAPIREKMANVSSDIEKMASLINEMVMSVSSVMIDTAAKQGNIPAMVDALRRLPVAERNRKIRIIKQAYPSTYASLQRSLV